MTPQPMLIDIADHHRRTQSWTTEEHGAYLLLCAFYWFNDYLPNDDRQLARIVLLPLKRWMAIRPILAAFFGSDWASHADLDAQRLRIITRKRARKP
jgi:uncharacterized protein YdaU (DUF1376 family)